MLPEVEEKISYEDYNKFLTLASNLTHFLNKIGLTYESKAADEFLDNIAAKIESHLGE